MKTTKTIREWLEELPEPYRTQAIENSVRTGGEDSLNDKEKSMWWALAGSFVWAETEEGHYYWNCIAEQYEQNS